MRIAFLFLLFLTERLVNIMSPRTKVENEIIRERRKEHILEVSLGLFARLGYESTSISRIAKEAGISKGLLYNYFSSKEELLKELVHDLEEFEEQFRSEVVNEDPSVMLENVINIFFKLLVERKEQLKLITAITFQVEKFAFVQDIVKDKMGGYLALFEHLLSQLEFENPKEEALMLGIAFDGVATQYLIVESDYPLDKIKSYLLKKYCKK